MVFKLLCNLSSTGRTGKRREPVSCESLKKKKLIELFDLMRPFFDYQDSRGRTMLMHLVINNSNPLFRNYLLGANYNEEDKEFQFSVQLVLNSVLSKIWTCL